MMKMCRHRSAEKPAMRLTAAFGRSGEAPGSAELFFAPLGGHGKELPIR